MTTPYTKCKECGYEGKINWEIYEGLCETCGKKFGNIYNIIEKIRAIQEKGTQTSPDYYSDLFMDIMKFGGLNQEDIIRFFKYIKIK